MSDKAILFKFLGDASDLKRGVKESDDALDGFKGRVGKFATDVGDLAKKGGVLLAAGLAAGATALYQLGDDFDSAYDGIRVTTGKTGDALAGLESDFKSVVTSIPTDFESAGNAVAVLNQRLGLTGKPLQEASKSVLELTRLTGGDLDSALRMSTRLVGDWGLKNTKIAPTLDKLFRASQATGIGVDRLGEVMTDFGAPLRGLGFNFDETAAMLSKWEKEGVNTEVVLGSMKKAFGTFSKEFGDKAPAEFRKFVDEVAKAPDSASAAQIAIAKLGTKGGPDFAAAVKEGRFAYGDLLQQISGGGETIGKASEDTMDWKEKLDILKNKAFVALEPVANEVFSALGDGVAELRRLWDEHGAGIIAGFMNIWGRAKSVWDSVGTPIFNTIITVFNTLRQWWEDNGTPIIAKVQEIISKIQPILEGLGEYVRTVLGVIMSLWEKVSDNILGVVQGVWTVISGVISGAMDVIKGVIDVVMGIITLDWSRVWNGLKGILGGVWDAILSILKGAWEIIKGLFGVIWGTIQTIWSGLWNWVKDFVGGIWGSVSEAISGGFDMIVGFFKGLPDKLKSAGSGMWNFISDGFKGAVNTVIRGWNALDIALGPWEIPSWVPLVGGKKFGIPDLFPDVPLLAKGGIVSGPTMAMIGEGGGSNPTEVVFPANDPQRGYDLLRQAGIPAENQGGGVTVNQTIVAYDLRTAAREANSEAVWAWKTSGK